MRDRHIPCTECRKQRRKCIQTDPYKPCLRCEKIGRVCINPDNVSVDPNNEIDNLKGQVEQLSLTIKGFEDEMRALQQDKNAPLQQAMIENLCYNWKVRIRNGCFSIDTGIEYLSELLPYQQHISYLSPINTYSSSSSEDDWREESGILVSFKTREYGSLYGLTGKILSKCLRKKILESPPLMLEYSSLGLHAIMNQLINLYFNCHNIHLGMVHENSFRENLKLVEDPFDDLISFAICCYVCSTPCYHLDFNTQQRRIMSDYFYSKTKDGMLDQFDDPDKKMENVIAINLLFQYMHMALKFLEYDSYITVAYQICLGLKAHYKIVGPQPTIEYALYTRHLAGTYCLRIMLDCVTGKAITRQPLPFPKLISLADEPEATRRFMQAQASIVSMYDHPFIDMLVEQIHLIYIGSTCTVKLEVLLRLDEIVSEHRQTVPEQMHFCKDIYNEEQCKKEIDNSEDFFTIFTFIQFSIIILGFHASFLQPVILNNETEELLHIIRQQSFDRSQKAARLALYGIKRISQLQCISPCHFQLATTGALLYIFDTLILQCSAENMATEARQMFFTGLASIGKTRGIQESDLPSSIQITKCDIREFIRSRTVDINHYNSYPDPWYALMYDLSRCL
ncbi:unnamed protein product [Rhizopus stolonifer]